MAELDEIHVTNGVPDSGTGEVPTLAVVRDAIEDLTAQAVETSNFGTPAAAGNAVGMQGDPAGIPVPVSSGGNEYETVAASQSDQVLGATGAQGDYLECLIIVVATAATAQVQIKDGNGSAITIFPNNPGGGIGTYTVPIGLPCINATTPGWKITTGAGSSVLATGRFT